jgi:hypothetical protein
MMNKITCSVIADLLELYADSMVSDDTKALLREHFDTCPACAEKLELIKQNISIPAETKASPAKNALKRIKKKIKLKYVIIFASTAALIIALVTTFDIIKQIRVQLSYEEAGIYKVEEGIYTRFGTEREDEAIIMYHTGVCFGSYGQYIINEEEKTAEFHVYFFTNIDTKHFRDNSSLSDYPENFIKMTSKYQELYCEDGSVEIYDVVKVYYCTFDGRIPPYTEHKCGDKHLIWERGE